MPGTHGLKYDHAIAESYVRHRGVRPEILTPLVEESGIDRGSRVLEVGCGTGNYIIAVQFITGCTAFGVDISEEMLVHAERRESPVSFALGMAERLDFADAGMDFVFTVDVVHHLGGTAEHYREAHRVLAPGGSVCTITHSEEMFRDTLVMSRYFPATIDVNLERYPPVVTLRDDMRAAGFRELREAEVAHPAGISDSGLFASRAYSPLHLIAEDAYERGLARLERDLSAGPIKGTRRYLLIWAVK